MSAIYINWTEEGDFFDLTCPNIIHHTKYGYDWATPRGSILDLAGHKCMPYTGCDICDEDTGSLEPVGSYIYRAATDKCTYDQRCKIAKKTDCIIIRKTDIPAKEHKEEWYIAPTRYGFDMAPDVVAAYLIADCRIPSDMLLSLDYSYCKQCLEPELFAQIKVQIAETITRQKALLKYWQDAEQKTATVKAIQ